MNFAYKAPRKPLVHFGAFFGANYQMLPISYPKTTDSNNYI